MRVELSEDGKTINISDIEVKKPKLSKQGKVFIIASESDQIAIAGKVVRINILGMFKNPDYKEES
jgi:hypothetical protein